MIFNKIQHPFVMKNIVDLVRGDQHGPTQWKFGIFLTLALQCLDSPSPADPGTTQV